MSMARAWCTTEVTDLGESIPWMLLKSLEKVRVTAAPVEVGVPRVGVIVLIVHLEEARVVVVE